jgi:hypothetical protein
MSQPVLVTTEHDWNALAAQTTVWLEDAVDVGLAVRGTEDPPTDDNTPQEEPMADPELLPEPGLTPDGAAIEDERRSRLTEEDAVDADTQTEAEQAQADADAELEP